MRPSEVFVRELSPAEGRLKQVSTRAMYKAMRQRAMILLASSTGMPVPQIATVGGSDESQVRKVIDAFNDRGFASLDPVLTRGSVPELAVRLAGAGTSGATFTEGPLVAQPRQHEFPGARHAITVRISCGSFQ